jgi:hypothetical protein
MYWVSVNTEMGNLEAKTPCVYEAEGKKDFFE